MLVVENSTLVLVLSHMVPLCGFRNICLLKDIPLLFLMSKRDYLIRNSLVISLKLLSLSIFPGSYVFSIIFDLTFLLDFFFVIILKKHIINNNFKIKINVRPPICSGF